MYHFLQLLKACFYTALIIGVPTIIATGGHVPPALFGHPAYQFAIIFVFGYAAGPVISDFLGHHAGTALFFPNKPNLGHPTISHIITLINKRHYKEAQEELRMLTEIAPTDFRAYKMLLQITAIHIPDRGLFDMFFRKGMQNLLVDDEKELLKRYKDELVGLKTAQGVDWTHNTTNEPEANTRHFYINRKHHREKAKSIVAPHSATLPARETKKPKLANNLSPREERSNNKKAIVPHHFQQHELHPHMAPLLPEVHTIILEKSENYKISESNSTIKIDSSIEHFVPEKTEEPKRFRFQRGR